MKQFEEWEGFKGRIWKEEINTRDFIQENYTPYDGDESFLAGSTEATDKLWGILQGLQKEERKKGGVLDMDTDIVSSLTSHGPGYISEETKDLKGFKHKTKRGENYFLTIFDKFFSTFRTSDTDFTFSPRDSDFLFTAWTFINMIFLSLLHQISFLSKKTTQTVFQCQIFLIFCITF